MSAAGVPRRSHDPGHSFLLVLSARTSKGTRSELKESYILAKLQDHAMREEKDGPGFVPAKMYSDRRSSSEVISVSWLMLDMDDGADWAHYSAYWREMGLSFAIHTTHSHTADHPKWRAAFPLARAIPAAEWKEWRARACEFLSGGSADPATCDPARLYYWPSVKPGAPYHAERHEGEALDPDSIPAAEEPEPVEEHPASIRPGSHAEGKRPGDEFEERTTWEDILLPHGWLRSSEKWESYDTWTHPRATHPLSARTGYGKDGKDRLYALSPNLGVPANRLLTKFMVYAHLEHGGDASAAAKALAALGYGDRPQRGRPGAAPEADPPRVGENGEILPEIVVTSRQLREVSADAWAALLAANDPPRLFRRDKQLVEILDDAESRPQIRTLDPKGLRAHLVRVADWRRLNEKGELRSVVPPLVHAEDVLSHYAPFKDLPELIGVSPCPLLSKDGTFAAAGYDRATRWYVSPTFSPAPAEMDGPAAAARFLEPFAGFPFVGDADRAAFFSLALHAFLRAVIDGPTPMTLFEAAMPNTGKSLLCECASLVGLGTFAFKSLPRDDAEMRKLLISELLEGAESISFDNVRGHVSSAELEGALTSTFYAGRLLSLNATGRYRNAAAWTMSANNATLSPDLTRRTILCRLDANMEDPGKRTFKVDIRRYVRDNRAELAGYLMAMILHWVRTGRNEGGVKLGSFESWASTVSGILESCSVLGLDTNREMLRASADTDTQNWQEFVKAWWEQYGPETKSAKELIEGLDECEGLSALLAGAKEGGRVASLGMKLGKKRGAIFGGHKIEQSDRSTERKRGFKLVAIEPGVTPCDTLNQPSWETRKNDLSTVKQDLFSGDCLEGQSKVSQGVTPSLDEALPYDDDREDLEL